MIFGGIPIHVTPYALKDSERRLFPESKHRSKRIRKKLIKRHGGEFQKVPAIYQIRNAHGFVESVIMHPDNVAALKQEIAKANAKETAAAPVKETPDAGRLDRARQDPVFDYGLGLSTGFGGLARKGFRFLS